MSPTQQQIDEMADLARDTNGTCFGMSYEDGVMAALDWVSGYTDEKPIEE